MRSRIAFLICIVCFLVAALFSAELQAQGTYEQGVSDVSLGRFGTWAGVGSGELRFFEEDLVKRIYADYLRRDHRDLDKMWDLYFGAASHGDSLEIIPHYSGMPVIDSTVWSEEQNWVYKKFAVLRDGLDEGGTATAPNYSGDYTYAVSVNCIGPGTRIQTKYNLFYLENTTHGSNIPHGFGYLAYQRNGSSEVKGDFAAPNQTINVNGSWLDENWVLLFDSQDYGQYAVHIPVVVSFSHRPSKIQSDEGHIRFIFAKKPPGEEMTIFLTMPFGVSALDPDTTAQWINGLPQDVIDRCRLINRLVNNWPVAVDEKFKFEDTSNQVPRVFVRNTFSFCYMGQAWEGGGYVSNTPYSLIPPVLSLAGQVGVDVTIPSRFVIPEAVDIGFPTKNGPILMVDLISMVDYEIPGAPVHDVHLVGTSGETIWKQRTNRMVNRSGFISDKYRWTTSMFCCVGNSGETAALAMTRDWTQEHYLNYMESTINERVFDYYQSHVKYPSGGESGEEIFDPNHGWEKMTWENIPPPPEGEWPPFWTYMYRTVDFSSLGGPAIQIPGDIDASAGTLLEFLYEYALWSGDWPTLAGYWQSPGDVPGIPDIFFPFELLHDWAYMASSHDIWGGAGAEMDMFNAQMAGYGAFAKIAEALGHDAEARRARYLAAKAQMPFVMRWASKDYVGQYFKTLDNVQSGYTQVMSGFGEWEPSGPGRPGNDFPRTVDHWADWTIAGERIHLLGYDILRTVLDEAVASGDPFKNALDQFLDVADECLIVGGDQGHKLATFAEQKLYGFFKYRDLLPLDKNTLVGWIDTLYCDFSSSPSLGCLDGAKYWAQVYMIENHPEGWYNGGAGQFYSSTARTFLTFPLMPAIAEAHGVPVRVGAWAPAMLVSASYDPDLEKFTAEFEQGSPVQGAPDPIVRLQVDSEPTSIVVSGGSGTVTYDPLWKVVEIPLTGSGPWTVDATIVPGAGASWNTVDPEPNLVSNPGFEESGYDHPNIELGWEMYCPSLNLVHTTTDSAHSGNQCARLLVPDSTSVSYLRQWLWVGHGNEFTLEFWYQIGSNDLQLTLMVNEHQAEPGEHRDPPRLILKRITCPPCSGGDCYGEPGDCTGEWRHFSVTDTISQDSAVVEVVMYAGQRTGWKQGYYWQPGITHEIYIDDVVLTCPALDTGGGGGKGGDDPIIDPVSPQIPLLSEVKIQPNPFNPSTVIGFKLGQSKHVSLKIYDLAGRLVRTLVDDELKDGPHQITWDGKTNKGTPTASGIYFYKLSVAHRIVTGKLVLIK